MALVIDITKDKLYKQGIEKGIEKGLLKKSLETAILMLVEGMNFDQIQKLTGLSLDQIQELKNELDKKI